MKAKLSRDLGLFPVTMIGVGAMIGAGIFVLTGIAAGISGPAILIAFTLNGIVALFTASAYAELGGSIPEAGGGYLWVKESLPQPSGFLSGWMSWMAHSVACSLYAVGFGAYFGEVLLEFKLSLFFPPEILKKILAVLVVIIFSYINYRGAKETGTAGNIVTILKILILFLFISLGSRIIFGEPLRFGHFFPFFPKGFMGILTAMGLTYIAFEGYEIIAQSGEEVKDPVRNIPKAIFLSLLIVIPIYILVAFIALGVVNPDTVGMTAWDFLAEKKEIAMVEAARNISRWGGAILLIGGLLSTVSALNATIYSSSRVSFAMGRDFNLPEIFSRVDKKFRTPSGSVFISAILISVMILLLPIEDIASSADIMFLFLFIFVNIALIHIRRKKPQLIKGYKSPLFPLFPVLGVLTQGILILVMFSYSPKSFFISLLWIGMGLSIYYGYSKLREEEEVGPKVLIEEKELAHRDFRIVLGIEKQKEMNSLMKIAIPISKAKEGEIFVTNVIPLPPQTPLNVGKRYIEEKRELLKEADKLGEKNGVPVSFSIRVSHQVHQALLDASKEDKADILLLGLSAPKRSSRLLGQVLDPVLQLAPCDVGILSLKKLTHFKKILVPTAGGPNAKLALQWAGWIALKNKGKVSLLFVIKREEEMDKAKHWLIETQRGIEIDKKIIKEKILKGKNIFRIIKEQSDAHDITIIGASREGFWSRVRFGTFPEKLVRETEKPVLVVRKYEGPVLSWIRRFIAG